MRSSSPVTRASASFGMANSKRTTGSSSTFSACISALRIARQVASRKSPPSVCLRCARPAISRIRTSHSGLPVNTPGCARSKTCVRISRCQFSSSELGGQSAANETPLPGAPGSSFSHTSA